MENNNTYVALYTVDNITLWAKIESHTSYISNRTYDQIESLKITVDGKLFYSAGGNALQYPYNHDYKWDIIDFITIVDDIVFLVKLAIDNKRDFKTYYSLYNEKIVSEPIFYLDELLYKKSCMTEIRIRQLKKQIEQENRQKEYEGVQKEVDQLRKECDLLATKNNLFVYTDYEYDTVIVSKVKLTKDIMEKHREEAKQYTVATFYKTEYEKTKNIWRHEEIAMYKDIMEFLKINLLTA